MFTGEDATCAYYTVYNHKESHVTTVSFIFHGQNVAIATEKHARFVNYQTSQDQLLTKRCKPHVSLYHYMFLRGQLCGISFENPLIVWLFITQIKY